MAGNVANANVDAEIAALMDDVDSLDAVDGAPLSADKKAMLCALCTFIKIKFRDGTREAFENLCLELMKKVMTAKNDPAVNVKVEDTKECKIEGTEEGPQDAHQLLRVIKAERKEEEDD